MNKKYLWIILPLVAALLAVPAIADNISVTATVSTYVSVVFNYDTVNFGTVAPGSTDVPAPGQQYGIYNVSITTNVPLNVYAYRETWIPSDLTLKFAISPSIPTSPQYTLVPTSQQVYSITIPGEYIHYNGYWLTVPSDAPAGTYSTTVTITYVPS